MKLAQGDNHMNKYYTCDIAGREELLPIIPLPSGIEIAFFNLHGNQDLTEYCGKKLAEKLRVFEPEIILTAESKGLQLSHVAARELGHSLYAVARKSKKLYMTDGISATVRSITTDGEQKLYLSKHDTDLINGKRVAIVDDVISTGSSLIGLEQLVQIAGGNVVAKAAVLAEGDAARRTDIIFLGTIPLL